MAGEQRPRPPADLSMPGLIYRRRQRWAMYWAPRSDLTKRGYQGRTIRLWPSSGTPSQQSEPTRAEWEVIGAWCVRYHAAQLLWAHGGVKNDLLSVFDGTIGSLIEIYQTHKRSPFQKLRYDTNLQYVGALAKLNIAIGKVRVKHVTFEDVTNWQEKFADDNDGSKPKKARSARLIGHIKHIFLFGALVLPKEAGCHDVCDIFEKMRKAQLLETSTKTRNEYMTVTQCRLLRAKAHEHGCPSIALEQAFAFELGLRQKDVIGEWIPVGWPGLSDVVWGPRKWGLGIRWDEIDGDLILRHRLSKSLRGKDAVMDPEAGKVKAWDLRVYPMIMDELRRIAGKEQFTRADLPASGPLIMCEAVDRPWVRVRFARMWRVIATAAGIPGAIQNRDSRPGAATEADLAGAPREKTQRMLGHAKGETTGIYLREDLAVNTELARIRTEKRK